MKGIQPWVATLAFLRPSTYRPVRCTEYGTFVFTPQRVGFTQNSEETVAGRVENLKPFAKGVSGNPGGRPKTAHISEALRRALENGEAEQLASILLALATGKKRGSAVQIAASVRLQTAQKVRFVNR